MVPTAASIFFGSISHAATTWQSACAIKPLVLFGPCMPQPITPTAIRSDAATRPARAKGLEATIAAAPADFTKLRRENRESVRGVCISISEVDASLARHISHRLMPYSGMLIRPAEPADAMA